jgi:hypothetical protein
MCKKNYRRGSKLNELCSNVGIPLRLFTDNDGEKTGGEWETVRRKYLIPQGYTEPHTPWQNKAELEIGRALLLGVAPASLTVQY